jgi:16S rRNA (uracil1498-N3)-methyltransferase
VSRPVFLAEPGSLEAVGIGDRYVLGGPEARHAASVRRIRVGESLEVVDGAGTALIGVVEAVEPESVVLRVAERAVEADPDVALVLVQALAKGDRDERAIEAATEIGADAVVPWQAERSVSVWSGPRQERGERRWAVEVAAAAVSAGSVVIALHESATVPLASVALPTEGEVVVVVGPEGGLTEAEVGAMAAAGAAVVRLGPHVLRTSTAGPVALAILAERLGRWARPGPAR